MSDEDAAKLANRFELPDTTEAFWGGWVTVPDQPSEFPAEPKRLTFVGLWRHALGFPERRR